MKISIITATFNSESTIETAIQSVANQTYSEIEHIIIDGGSTDNTLSIIEQNKAKISKVISEPDEGIYDALNKGIKLATGNLIAFLHADDFYANENSIKNSIELLKNKNTDSVYADLQYVSKDDVTKVVRNWVSGDFSYNQLKKGWMPPHPTFIVKKEAYEKYGYFNTNFKIAADYDLVLRFLGEHKISTTYLPEIIIKMRVGGASNRSLKNIIQKSKEDLKALRTNKVGGIFSLFYKNISKIPQFFTK